MGSLKTLLDFTVSSHLLYDKERNQYGRLVKRKIPAWTSSSQGTNSTLSKSSTHISRMATSYQTSTVAEVSSTVRLHSGENACCRQPLADPHNGPASGSESVRSPASYLSRASVTEHSYSRSPEFLVIAEAARVLEQSETVRKNDIADSTSRRVDLGNSELKNGGSHHKEPESTTTDNSHTRRTRSRSLSVSVRAEPPAEVLSALSPAKAMSGWSLEKPAASNILSTPATKLSLVPPSYLDMTSSQSRYAVNFVAKPSEVYGPVHLLRLFGKIHVFRVQFVLSASSQSTVLCVLLVLGVSLTM